MDFTGAELVPGLCTMKEIAVEAGVGVGTVHRVLRGGAPASEAARVKVFSAMAKLNSSRVRGVNDLQAALESWLDEHARQKLR